MPDPKDTLKTRIVTRFIDEFGDEFHRTQYREDVIEDDQGCLTSLKEGEQIILGTGEAYHPGLSAGPRPIMMIALCRQCREERPRWPWQRARTPTGLVNVKHVIRCRECGAATCPTHRKQSRYDHKWRCIKCHTAYQWRRRLASIVCEEVDE
jgi:hypothetical protein